MGDEVEYMGKAEGRKGKGDGGVKGKGTCRKDEGDGRTKSKSTSCKKGESDSRMRDKGNRKENSEGKGGELCLWIKDLDLNMNDYEVLCSKRWLNEIIYAAQILLQQQSEGRILGWKSTQCAKCVDMFPPLPPNAQYIQILNVSKVIGLQFPT